VNQDALKTPAKCKREAEQALKDGDSVVIDNTNPSQKKRYEFLKIATSYNVPTRCFLLDYGNLNETVQLAKHMNGFRTRLTGQRPVPGVAFNSFAARYQKPSMGEGFASVISIPFIPAFLDEREQELFSHWVPKFR